jgi:hypothetical protein
MRRPAPRRENLNVYLSFSLKGLTVYELPLQRVFVISLWRGTGADRPAPFFFKIANELSAVQEGTQIGMDLERERRG